MEGGIDAGRRWCAAPPAGAEPLPGAFVLPGLVDAHCPLSVAPGPGGAPAALGVDGARAGLSALAAGGVTVVRDVGSPGSVSLLLAPDAEAGGARLLAAGRFLAPPGRYLPGLYDPVPADGLVRAALAEIAAGATWVKLVADFRARRRS